MNGRILIGIAIIIIIYRNSASASFLSSNFSPSMFIFILSTLTPDIMTLRLAFKR